jgi:hypothetical protein
MGEMVRRWAREGWWTVDAGRGLNDPTPRIELESDGWQAVLSSNELL